MRLVSIADQHGRLPDIPECDVLILAGDICPDFPRIRDPHIMRLRQEDWLETKYREWESRIPARHIVCTPGNHDWIIRLPEGLRTRMFIDEGCEIDGTKFWCTPWIVPVGNWNYMLTRTQRAARFREIPEGLDVLVSHSPAHRVLDRTIDGDDAGCIELRSAIYRAKPKVCVFGHIHECGGGRAKLGSTKMFNCAMTAPRGQVWRPVVFDILANEKVENNS